MKRFIDQELLDWKRRHRRKPLIVRGARQVGKTYSIRSFGENHFDNLALVDLERNPELHRIFSGRLDAKQIIADMEIFLRQKIQSGKTLLFIDEIQACPRAITALRYLYEEMPDLHVIAAGSLLEFAMKGISFPVGRIQFIQLYPLCFVEYLFALGHSEAAEILLKSPEVVSEPVHEFLLEQLRRYFFVGGMPEGVLSYVESGSMQEAFDVQAEICETYRMDFAKYRPQVNKECLNATLTSVSQKVGQQTKYSRLAMGFSNPTLKKAFDLLAMAKIITKIPSANPSGLPLGASASDRVFKSIMVDMGLMRYLTGMPIEVEYQKKELLHIYQGSMAEQFVGQEMLLSQNGSLHYWSRRAKSSSAEVDYLAIVDGKIYPVEVKSGPSGRLKSLHLFLKTYQNCPKGIVFSSRPYNERAEERIAFVPLYYAFSATGGGKVAFG